MTYKRKASEKQSFVDLPKRVYKQMGLDIRINFKSFKINLAKHHKIY
jgi:hypothetical protein